MRKSPKIVKRVVRYFIFKHHKNILDFSHFDVNTLHFLGLIGSLLTADLKLNLQCTSNSRWKCEENLRTILTNLAPLLLDGVHSLSFSAEHVGYKADWTFPMVKQYFGEQLANVKKVLEIFVSGMFPHFQINIKFCFSSRIATRKCQHHHELANNPRQQWAKVAESVFSQF